MLNAASRWERLAMEDPQLVHLVTRGNNHTSSTASQADSDDQTLEQPPVTSETTTIATAISHDVVPVPDETPATILPSAPGWIAD